MSKPDVLESQDALDISNALQMLVTLDQALDYLVCVINVVLFALG